MRCLPAHESLVAGKLAPSFRNSLELDGAYDIEVERRNRCLSPVGRGFFMDVLLGYLAGFPEDADTLVSKAGAFLALGHAIGEQEKYSYAQGFSEGIRSAALSYVGWLETGTTDPALIEDARSHLDRHFAMPGTLDRKTADIMAPTLLYLSAYELIEKMSRALAIDSDPARRVQERGPFGLALSIAATGENSTRQLAKEAARKKLGPWLLTWIEKGHYDHVAYSLFALHPRPEGRPSRLIEECWQYVPGDAPGGL